MRSAKVRVGVIGAGSWTVASHIPALAARPEVDLVAVARKGRAQLEQIARRWGFSVASEDFRDVLAAGVHVCVVGSPPHLHHEHARAALEAGAHVLLEKPITIVSADAWDLVRVAHEYERHVVCAFGWNYKPFVLEAKALLAQRPIGIIEHVAIRMSSQMRTLLRGGGSYADAAAEVPPESATWTDPAISGGGYGQAQLTHALALALWLGDLRAEEVFSLVSPSDAEIELHDAAVIRFAGGAIGTLSGQSVHHTAHHLEVRLVGEDGDLIVDVEPFRERVLLSWAHGEASELSIEDGSGAYTCDAPSNLLIDLALGKDRFNPAPLELGARTVETVEALYRSARARVPVAVDRS